MRGSGTEFLYSCEDEKALRCGAGGISGHRIPAAGVQSPDRRDPRRKIGESSRKPAKKRTGGRTGKTGTSRKTAALWNHILYGTTPLFLEKFGIGSLKELPVIDDIVKDWEEGAESSQQMSMNV